MGFVFPYKEQACRLDGRSLRKFERQDSYVKEGERERVEERTREHTRIRFVVFMALAVCVCVCLCVSVRLCGRELGAGHSPQWNTAFTSRLSDKNRSGFLLRAWEAETKGTEQRLVPVTPTPQVDHTHLALTSNSPVHLCAGSTPGSQTWPATRHD